MTDDVRSEPLNQQPTGETALEETVSLLESILEGTHDAILVLDLKRRLVRYNSKFLQMFGLTPDQMDANGIEALIAAITAQLENPDVLLANARELFIDPSTEVVDLLRFKDGRVYHRFVAPHRLHGRIVGRVASYRDITAQLTTQRALEQHRTFLEKAQEVAHIGSWVAELDGSDRLEWSTETYRIFGIGLNDFAETSAEFFAFVHPDDHEYVRLSSEAAIGGGKAYDVEHRIVLRSGRIRWVHEKADIVRDEQGMPLRMVGTVQDITDRRLLEEQLRQSQKLEAIGRLAGGIAHDMNNALTAIASYTELALMRLPAEHEARVEVEGIGRAAERAETVTRQLLAFSRKHVLEPRAFSIADLVASLAPLLERLLGGSIRVKTAVAPDLPPIYGDAGQVEQTIINLAVNARDAMVEGGTLTIALSAIEVDEEFARAHQPLTEGRYVEMRVADTGEGMSDDVQSRIFEPFFTTKEVGKGTGLGLSMVYGTVRQSGGHIFVNSERGKGTTFHLYFPDASSQGPAEPVQRPAGARRRATVLVVADEAAVRNLAVTALGHHGYRVLHASSVEEALAVAHTGHGDIDLVVTDARMPKATGFDLAVALRAERPTLPVLLMLETGDEALKNVTSGANNLPVLHKPFTPRGLRRAVAEVLSQSI